MRKTSKDPFEKWLLKTMKLAEKNEQYYRSRNSDEDWIGLHRSIAVNIALNMVLQSYKTIQRK